MENRLAEFHRREYNRRRFPAGFLDGELER